LLKVIAQNKHRPLEQRTLNARMPKDLFNKDEANEPVCWPENEPMI
jgi:hypothetical protein